jgi:hypothetical protein
MAGTVVGPSPLRGGADRDRRARAAARPRRPRRGMHLDKWPCFQENRVIGMDSTSREFLPKGERNRILWRR